jgi:beta-glucosidase/6-phospho-beta-glucosidase/beta-galactosidase
VWAAFGLIVRGHSFLTVAGGLRSREWAYAYSKPFGIVRVDYDTLLRTKKDSALWSAELALSKRLPD